MTAAWRPCPKRCLIPMSGLPGWLWIRSTGSCTGWKWALLGCTTKCASGPNSLYLATLLDLLLDRGFRVYLTSDHGNVEAEGCGRPAEGGVVADVRGERVRIYSDAGFRRTVKERFPDRAGMGPIGLPEDCSRSAGGSCPAGVCPEEKQRIVSHGGASKAEELHRPAGPDRADRRMTRRTDQIGFQSAGASGMACTDSQFSPG